MFKGALEEYKARREQLDVSSATATAAAKRAAQELVQESARSQNTAAEAAFHTQKTTDSTLKAVKVAAAGVEKETAALSSAVLQLERQTLLFGDLENYLAVIEGQVASICRQLHQLQERQGD